MISQRVFNQQSSIFASESAKNCPYWAAEEACFKNFREQLFHFGLQKRYALRILGSSFFLYWAAEEVCFKNFRKQLFSYLAAEEVCFENFREQLFSYWAGDEVCFENFREQLPP